MSMGAGVVLFVIGAILAFAVNVQTDVISLSTVGFILMAGGVVVFVIGLAFAIRGRRSVTTTSTNADGTARVQRSATRDDSVV